ncbi:hypothetical protein WME99_06075 [Sorangium sp. So ce136]|uniref:hypothetical protein n=1 Tax=Sorangium sp. So ce136 TaxID=3133284 RepID=UPI003F08DE37
MTCDRFGGSRTSRSTSPEEPRGRDPQRIELLDVVQHPEEGLRGRIRGRQRLERDPGHLGGVVASLHDGAQLARELRPACDHPRRRPDEHIGVVEQRAHPRDRGGIPGQVAQPAPPLHAPGRMEARAQQRERLRIVAQRLHRGGTDRGWRIDVPPEQRDRRRVSTEDLTSALPGIFVKNV